MFQDLEPLKLMVSFSFLGVCSSPSADCSGPLSFRFFFFLCSDFFPFCQSGSTDPANAASWQNLCNECKTIFELCQILQGANKFQTVLFVARTKSVDQHPSSPGTTRVHMREGFIKCHTICTIRLLFYFELRRRLFCFHHHSSNIAFCKKGTK